ncbi:MAG: hypothetical protein ACHQ2Y_05315 [Candidatus Lutacidiplasmatales archaeon]
MKGSVRAPVHASHWRDARPAAGPAAAMEAEERFVGRPCFIFNPTLREELNDAHCSHCRYYLTARCPHIGEFIDDVEDLSPE